MRVCVLGLGYIGFPTACLAAQAGHDVIGVDVNESIVNQLSNRAIHMANEDGMAELANAVLGSGKLRVSRMAERADVFIIAVPTPFLVGDSIDEQGNRADFPTHSADLSYVESASQAIVPFVMPGNLVVLESTVPPNSTERTLKGTLMRKGIDVSRIHFAHAPERVLPGKILLELITNDRVVGGLTAKAGELAREFYKTFVRGDILVTDAVTAELVKLMENTFRDVNIALANEFARICERLGVSVWDAIKLANHHPRVNFLHPGPGVGGHCIAVDPYFVIQAAPDLTNLIRTAREVNNAMPRHVVELFLKLIGSCSVSRVAILGASYKPNVTDTRESPSFEVAKLLESIGFTVVIHDPHVPRFATPLQSLIKGAEALLILTDHKEYRDLVPVDVGDLLSQRLILDARGCIQPAEWTSAGFRVAQVGGQVSEGTPPKYGAEQVAVSKLFEPQDGEGGA